MKARTVIEVIASLLIVLFLYAATTQVVSHPTFQLQINRSLSNTALSGIIAWLIPVIQLTMVFLLWRPATRLAAFSCSLAIVSCYTVYLLIMLPGAYKSYCNCGELWRQAIWPARWPRGSSRLNSKSAENSAMSARAPTCGRWC